MLPKAPFRSLAPPSTPKAWQHALDAMSTIPMHTGGKVGCMVLLFYGMSVFKIEDVIIERKNC